MTDVLRSPLDFLHSGHPRRPSGRYEADPDRVVTVVAVAAAEPQAWTDRLRRRLRRDQGDGRKVCPEPTRVPGKQGNAFDRGVSTDEEIRQNTALCPAAGPVLGENLAGHEQCRARRRQDIDVQPLKSRIDVLHASGAHRQLCINDTVDSNRTGKPGGFELPFRPICPGGVSGQQVEQNVDGVDGPRDGIECARLMRS